jgi:6-phospho-beta-glucosidase
MLDIAEDICRICPDAWLLNFTNPAGVVTEALLKYSGAKVIGLCNIPMEMHIGIAQMCGVDLNDVHLDYFGLNHLSWIRDVVIDGKSRMDEVLKTYIDLSMEAPDPLFDARLLEMLEMIPTYYVSFYYNHPRMLADQLQGVKCRAERVMEIEQDLLRLYDNPATVAKPPLLAERGGRHYSTVAIRLISAIVNNSGATQILDVPNGMTFANLPADAVVEVPCRVDALGAHPLPITKMPTHVVGLIEAVKASEQLTVEAALTGDERAALRAITAHPLVPSFAVARSLLAGLLAENIDYLPQFALEALEEV